MHHAPCHEMTHTIELRSLNSINVPNLVSIAKNFLEPEDPSRINFSGVVARSLHPTRTATTKTYMLGKHLFPEMLGHTYIHTYIHTDKHDPANFFFADPPEEIFVHKTCNAKALATFILYDFGLEAGTA